MGKPFFEVDVFGAAPYQGNPLAVVMDAEGMADEEMQQLARWTNLSETTFVLPPTKPEADYRVRIFTPESELPFAGHPTLGSCHAWLTLHGTQRDHVVQECALGLVQVRDRGGRLEFAAPPLVRSGPVEGELLAGLAGVLGLGVADIVRANWVDNGPGWVAVVLADAKSVLGIKPGVVDRMVGVVGPCPEGSETAYEVRAFFPVNGQTAEDPVTGSLNASLAQWLIGDGHFSAPYVVSQGTVLGRSGRVYIDQDPGGTIWVGGRVVTCVAGNLVV